MSQVGEIVGLVGVMGSLIFVGLEVRQSSIATRAASDAAIADAFREVNQTMAASPDLARALTTWSGSPDSASPADQVQILGLWRALFYTWSNAHRQHLNGTIDPVLFQSVVQEISLNSQATPTGVATEDLRRRGILMRWARSRERFLFNPDFQQFVDSILKGPG